MKAHKESVMGMVRAKGYFLTVFNGLLLADDAGLSARHGRIA